MFCAHFLLITAVAAANADLEKATKLVADLQYPEARSALESAIKRSGNDRDTLLRIYELQGIVYATLNDPTKAGKAFAALMVLEPERKLAGDYPPRVMTPFYEARGRASELGKLDAKALPAAIGNGRVGQLAVEVSTDPLKMVKKVRFHVKADQGPWVETPAELVGKIASISVDGARVEWWADVVGDREAVLVNLGTEAQPKVEGTAAAPVAKKTDPPLDTPLTPEAKPPPPELTRSSPTPPLRIVSFVLMGAGVAALGGGIAMGLMASQGRSKIDNAETNAQGQVTGITQKEAYALDAQVKSNATIANVLFGVGGGLAATGVALLVVSAAGSSGSGGGTLAIAPAGPGVALSGSF